MSELLRLANEVEEDMQYIIKDGLSDVGEPYSSQFKAYMVIKGYQDLLRQVLSLCDGGDSSSSQDIAEHWDWLIGEIEKALPRGEGSNE